MTDFSVSSPSRRCETASVNAGITLNSTTSTKIADANSTRRFFCVDNAESNSSVRIKLQPAGADDVKKGIYLGTIPKGSPFWLMPSDTIYTGEVSAIADMGTPTVYVTEF